MSKAKDILRKSIKEYDDMIAAGMGDALHRVAKLLLNPDRGCGRQLREWLASDLPLAHFMYAFIDLQTYALSSLVERRIESVHAI